MREKSFVKKLLSFQIINFFIRWQCNQSIWIIKLIFVRVYVHVSVLCRAMYTDRACANARARLWQIVVLVVVFVAAAVFNTGRWMRRWGKIIDCSARNLGSFAACPLTTWAPNTIKYESIWYIPCSIGAQKAYNKRKTIECKEIDYFRRTSRLIRCFFIQQISHFKFHEAKKEKNKNTVLMMGKWC